MTSLEKIELFRNAMLETDEVFDGPMGMIQGAIGMHAAGLGPDPLGVIAGDNDASTFDQQLIDVAAFALWLRSDEAPQPSADELAKGPEIIVGLLRDAGIGA